MSKIATAKQVTYLSNLLKVSFDECWVVIAKQLGVDVEYAKRMATTSDLSTMIDTVTSGGVLGSTPSKPTTGDDEFGLSSSMARRILEILKAADGKMVPTITVLKKLGDGDSGSQRNAVRDCLHVLLAKGAVSRRGTKQWRWGYIPPHDRKGSAGADVDNDKLNEAVAKLQRQVEQLQAEVATSTKTVTVKIEKAKPRTIVIEEKVHPIFEQVMFHLGCGDSVMLVGPRGSGKSFLCSQVAKAFEVLFRFASLSGGVTEAKVFGRVMPNLMTGEQVYHSTPFVDCFREGGVFLLDEVDAADPNVLLSLNSALANNAIEVDGLAEMILKHEKSMVMAAANTWGNGADRQYVGRNQQDAAFTERFVQLAMDYDEGLERSLYPNDELLETCHRYRRAIRDNRLERTMSTRFIGRAFNWLNAGKDMSYVDEMFFSGWRKDEVSKVKFN